MASDALLLMLLIAMVTVCGILLLVLLLRGQKGITAAQLDAFERGMRQEVSESARQGRQELAQTFSQFQVMLSDQVSQSVRTQIGRAHV